MQQHKYIYIINVLIDFKLIETVMTILANFPIPMEKKKTVYLDY